MGIWDNIIRNHTWQVNNLNWVWQKYFGIINLQNSLGLYILKAFPSANHEIMCSLPSSATFSRRICNFYGNGRFMPAIFVFILSPISFWYAIVLRSGNSIVDRDQMGKTMSSILGPKIIKKNSKYYKKVINICRKIVF